MTLVMNYNLYSVALYLFDIFQLIVSQAEVKMVMYGYITLIRITSTSRFRFSAY